MSVAAGEILPALEALEVARFKRSADGKQVLGLVGLDDAIQPLLNYAYDSNGNVVGLVNGNSVIGFSSRMILSNIMGRQWCKKQTVTTAGANTTAFTYHQTFTVETQATRFRVMIQNSSTTEIMTVTSGSIAVSNAIGTDVATNTTPSTATFVPLTWNTGNTSVAIPVATSSSRPKIQWSDWINIATIARTDGGSLPVVMVRTYILNGSTYSYGTYGLPAFQYNSVAGVNNGRFLNTWRATGDKVTGSPSMGAATSLEFCVPVMGVEYATRQAGLTIYAEGDSITEGATNGSVSTTFGNGWIWQTINLMRNLYPDVPIDLVNGGMTTTNSPNFLLRYQDTVAAGTHFDMVLYSPFSPNDGTPSQVIIDNQQRYLSQFSDAMATAKKPYILTTPCPNTAAAWTAPQDDFRLTQRGDLLNNRKSGIDVIDFESTLSDGATPARYNATYTTDGTHPNDAGYSAMAVVALPILSKYLPFA